MSSYPVKATQIVLEEMCVDYPEVEVISLL